MFQLEQAINELTKQIVSCSNNLSAHEIKDHLLSTVEDLVEQGSTEEAAFTIAVERIGNLSELKNQLRNIQDGENFMNFSNTVPQQIATALIFAAAILTTSWLGFSDTVTYLLIALWFIPFMWILKQSTVSPKDELHCLAKKLHLK